MRSSARIEPRPDAVITKIVAITTASKIRSTSTRGLGPPMMPPAIPAKTATVAATVRPRTWRFWRPTSRPALRRVATRTSNPSTNHSVRVGSPVDVDGVFPRDLDDHGGIDHEHRERCQRRRRSRPEPTDQPAGAQHRGQAVLEEPGVSRPSLGDVNHGAPAAQGWRSAGSPPATTAGDRGTERGHEAARGGVAVGSWVVAVRRHGRRLLRVVA